MISAFHRYIDLPLALVSTTVLSLCTVSCTSLVDPICLGDVAPSSAESWDALSSRSFESQNSSACYPNCGVVPSLNSCCMPEEYQCPGHELSNYELIDIALSNNPQTKIAWGQARSAYFNLGQAKSALYPTVNLDQSYIYTDTSSGGNINNQAASGVDATNGSTGSGATTGQLNSASRSSNQSIYYKAIVTDLSATYLLFDFGGREAQIESAKQALFAANWTQNRTLQDVMISVLQNYYGYLGSKAALKARYEDLKNAQESLDAAEMQHTAGLNTRVDVLLAISNVMQTELAIQNLIGESKINHGKLANAMGLGADSCFDVVPLPDHLPIDEVKENVCRLIETAQYSRDDFAAAYANYQQKKADLIVARAEGLPKINASTDLRRYSIWLSHNQSDTHDYVGALSISMPIFQGFYYYNRERQARANIDIACAQLQESLSNLLLDVVTSYYQFETATETVKYSEAFLAYSKEAYELSLDSYKMGIGTLLDLLKAQADLSNARAQYVQARTQWVTSLANIAYATGTL